MNKKNILNEDKEYLIEEDSIDLIKVFSILWKEKYLIIKSVIIVTIFGIIFSLSIKNTFKASSIFYPHIEKVNNTSQLAGLAAGLAGININEEISNNVPPTLYPNIINSPLFKIEILNTKINFKNKKIEFRDYLTSTIFSEFSIKKILYFPLKLLKKSNSNKINDENILELSDEEFQLHEYLSQVIRLKLNEKEGFIDLSVEDRDPYVASQIAIKANKILQKSIIDFKIKNIRDTYNFIDSQLDIAKENFYLLQDSLAKFRDSNKNIKSDLFLNQFSRIESEFLIAKNIYNELALDKEKKAIEVKKNTPIFTIIKPVIIPNEKYSPNRKFIVIICLLIGLTFSSTYILLEPTFKILKKTLNQKS